MCLVKAVLRGHVISRAGHVISRAAHVIGIYLSDSRVNLYMACGLIDHVGVRV